jgi:hypothetical protein
MMRSRHVALALAPALALLLCAPLPAAAVDRRVSALDPAPERSAGLDPLDRLTLGNAARRALLSLPGLRGLSPGWAAALSRTARVPPASCAGAVPCELDVLAGIGAEIGLVGTVSQLEAGWQIEWTAWELSRRTVLGRANETTGAPGALAAASARTAVRSLAALLSPAELPGLVERAGMFATAAAPPVVLAPAPLALGPPALTRVEGALPTEPPRWDLVAGGAGALCLVAGGVFGALELSAIDDEKRFSAARDAAAYWKARDSADSLAWTADLLVGAGAAAVAAGVFLHFTGAEPAVAVVPVPGGAALQVRGGF